jgi:hypothetical protein
VPFVSCLGDQRRNVVKESDDVEQINARSGKLSESEQDMAATCDEELRPELNADHEEDIHGKNGGQERTDVQPLIARHDFV